MTTTLALLLTLNMSFVDSTQAYYAEKDTAALQDLLVQADTRAATLLCRYRLYPLTEDAAYLEDLPTELEQASARELALLAGLWGYRAARASVFKVMTYGRRFNRLLRQAKDRDPDNPFVLLVEGQSLLFRPALLGGDKAAALRRFEKLRRVIDRQPNSGISKIETRLWIWFAHEKMDSEQAPALRKQLLAQDPAPLYREFLKTAS